MKKISLAFLLILSFSSLVKAVDYTDVRITGVGITPNDNFIRFTIDKDPYAIFLTKLYKRKQHDYVVSLILTAYKSNSKIAFMQSSEASSASIPHYTELSTIEVGMITHD